MTRQHTSRDPNDGPGSTDTSERVIEQVASAKGVEPEELDPPLHEVVDPASLDRLFEPAGDASATDCSVTFQYAGHRVTVAPAGDVRLG